MGGCAASNFWNSSIHGVPEGLGTSTRQEAHPVLIAPVLCR